MHSLHLFFLKSYLKTPSSGYLEQQNVISLIMKYTAIIVYLITDCKIDKWVLCMIL